MTTSPGSSRTSSLLLRYDHGMETNALEFVEVESFGPFRDASARFSPGLNVLVGDNSTGKTQFLKLLYSSAKVLRENNALTKKQLTTQLASKLKGTLRPSQLGGLVRCAPGAQRSVITIGFEGIGNPLKFDFSSRVKAEVNVTSLPDQQLRDEPVFLPSHELLSLSSSYLSLYEMYETGFEETTRDSLLLLQRPPLRGAYVEEAEDLVASFDELLLGGTVVEKDGRFFLQQQGIGDVEASLLAEGHRKLAMIQRLLFNGVLLGGGYLFWDEPETNLNPRAQKVIAHVLLKLVEQGTQVFVATHSMFLLRELQMSQEPGAVRYLGLSRDSKEDVPAALSEVNIECVDDLDDVTHFAALSAESEQSQRYLSW